MMRSSTLKESAAGATLGFISFILVFSSFPIQTVVAAPQPLFSMTLMAPTSNPVRRQWAAIISNSYQSVNINAKLVYVPFSTLANKVFGGTAPEALYNAGGFDVIFVGFGGGTVLPDFGTNNVLNYRTNDYTPTGNNYMGYTNATYDKLADQYANSFDPKQRATLAQQMVQIVAQDRPTMIIEQPALVTPFAVNIFPWNQQTAYSEAATGNDVQHFKVTAANGTLSSATLNVAETGDINSVDVLPTGSSNTLYDRYMYGNVPASLEELDIRNVNYYKALATYISSSADHLTWTVKFKAHTFWDGVPVTADDYLFYMMSSIRGDAGSVNLGTFQTILGLNTQFTYLNGTVDYVQNGTYSHKSAPSGWSATSTFKSANATAFTFTLPAAYVFTDPVVTGIPSLAMHVYEKVPASAWSTSFLSTLQNTPTTITWSTAQYGGNGTYKWAYGPVGDGPYVYRGYDTTANVGTMVRFDNYWNASGLKSIGEFGVKSLHVFFISGKDAAISAFKNGQINFMDGQYTFNHDDINTIAGIGGVSAISVDPSAGWQEMGLNMQHPVYGTGTGTPLGTSNPSQAAFAARQVRKALSYLIPRSYIIQSLLQGLAQPGITDVCTCFAFAYPAGVTADPYDPTAAKSFLAAAGYNTGVAPPPVGGTVTLPPIATLSPITVGNKTVNLNVKVPSFLLGNAFSISGAFHVDPVKTSQAGGFAVILEQSLDNKTWTPVTFTLTETGTTAYTITYSPTTTNGGNPIEYRVLFTGIGANYIATTGLSNATIIQAQLYNDTKVVNGLKSCNICGSAPKIRRAANITVPAFGPVSSITVGSLADVINALANGISNGFAATSGSIKDLASSVNTNLNSLQSSISQLQTGTVGALNQLQSTIGGKADQSATASQIAAVQTSVNNLSNQITSLTDVAYAALIIAIVLGLVAIALAARKRS